MTALNRAPALNGGQVDRYDSILGTATYSSSESGDFCGCIIRVYRRKLGSTHDGNSVPLVCKAVMACRGLGAVVDTARITEINWSPNSQC